MTPAHWVYLLGALVIIIAMIFRKNIVVPSIVFTILVAWVYNGSFVFGIQSLFNADLYAANQLFNVFLVITLMVGMLRAASSLGADRIMIRPIQKLMVSPTIAYLILAAATFVISLFFWPTPAIPLVGALLIPAAVRAGLSPMTAAVAVAMAGQGMALAGDLVLQAAPKITATAAGISPNLILGKAGLLTVVTGVIALGLAFVFQRKEDQAFSQRSIEERMRVAGMLSMDQMAATTETASARRPSGGSARVLAVLIPVVLLAVIVVMVTQHITGGDATALLGGAGAVLLCVAGMMHRGKERLAGLEAVSDFLVDGFIFAFRAMGPVIPIAGFFFLGGPDGAVAILGKNAPGFLFDAALRLGHALPPGSAIAAFGVLILGMLTGLDGSGFAGLPLVGATAGALGHGSPEVVSMLGAVGQIGSVWTGGGTIIAWSTLVAVAGIAGVKVQDLVKKNFLPVVIGLVVSTILAVILW
ncbi:MAG: hypothetical protein K6T78_06645 [Alicyclobacillus sp.]|nr:hypothetical protein [Alicyclobacillus sp.]